MVALLSGALIGNMFGTRGNLELRVGTDSCSFIDEDKLAQPLGFTLKLDKFDIEKYPTEYRMYVFAEGDKRYSVIQTASIKDCREWIPVSGTETRYRVAEYYPDIQIEDTLKACNDPSAPSAVRVKVLDGKAPSEKWVMAGPPTGVVKGLQIQCIEPGGHDALAAATGSPTPEKHLITIDHNTFEVRLGQTYTAPGSGRKFTVVEFLPDFYYDFQKKGAATRSAAPNNPALGIEETTAGKAEREWLFANMPGHGHKPEQLDAVYKYIPPVSPIEQLWAIDGKTQELIFASGGKIVLSQSLKAGQQQQVSIPASEENGNGRIVTIELQETLDHAVMSKVARTLSQEPKNPGVLVEVKRGDSVRQAYLVPDADSAPIEDGLSLAFKARSEQPKAYKSYVSVVNDEGAATQSTIAVNAPLKYNGYTFYQSGYRSDKKGDCSSFRVVNDPGLGAVYAGLIMVAIGVIYTYYVRPRQTAGGNSRLKEGLS
jgi:hypothetical protein